MNKTYLFLDVDGVLHPFEMQIHGMPRGTRVTFSRIKDYGCDVVLMGPPFSRLPVLEQVIRPYLDSLQIVVSSSWRLYPESYDHLLTAMSPDVRACVAGGTSRDLHGGRPIEISAWLAQHGETGSQVIVVDDDLDQPWNLLPDGATFLETDYAVGFSELDAAVLGKLLADGAGQVNRVRRIITEEEKRAVVEGRQSVAAPAEGLG